MTKICFPSLARIATSLTDGWRIPTPARLSRTNFHLDKFDCSTSKGQFSPRYASAKIARNRRRKIMEGAKRIRGNIVGHRSPALTPVNIRLRGSASFAERLSGETMPGLIIFRFNDRRSIRRRNRRVSTPPTGRLKTYRRVRQRAREGDASRRQFRRRRPVGFEGARRSSVSRVMVGAVKITRKWNSYTYAGKKSCRCTDVI